MTPPSTPKRDPNPFARQSIWPPMPKTSFRVAQPVAPPPPPPAPKPSRGSIYATSAVPMPLRRAPEDLQPVEAAPAPRVLPQTAPPIPPARPIPQGPIAAAQARARPAPSGPPVLALTAAGLVGLAGLGVLFLLLGRQAPAPVTAPAPIIAAPAAPMPRYATALRVGQVISPVYPDLRGPMVAQNADPAAPPVAPTPVRAAPPALALAPASRPASAPVLTAVAAPPPPRVETTRAVAVQAPRPVQAQAFAAPPRPAQPRAAAPLPRLTGPMSDEPFLTVTTRRIAAPQSAASQAAAPQAAAPAPAAPYAPPTQPRTFAPQQMPYRQSYPPVVGYVRPAPSDPDAPIATTRSGQ